MFIHRQGSQLINERDKEEVVAWMLYNYAGFRQNSVVITPAGKSWEPNNKVPLNWCLVLI